MDSTKPFEHEGHDGHSEGSMSMCALISQAVQEDLGGTAASVSRYVMVEAPLPWHSDALSSRYVPSGLKDQLKQLASEGHRFKTLVFTSDKHNSDKGICRLFFFQKPEAPLARFEKLEYVVPGQQAGALVRSYLEGGSLEPYEAYLQPTGDVRDMFVCTHGSHDACCGKFGYGTYQELEEKYASQSAGKLRVWRVSHIGGHRLAPTLIDFPEGRYWGHLTSATLESIVNRHGPTEGLIRHVRGWGALTAPEQLVERQIFAVEGWPWITTLRSTHSQPQEDGGVRVRIEYQSDETQQSGAYTALVKEKASIEVYGCEYEAPRAYPQYEVSEFQKET